jgi:hypothetical protein
MEVLATDRSMQSGSSIFELNPEQQSQRLSDLQQECRGGDTFSCHEHEQLNMLVGTASSTSQWVRPEAGTRDSIAGRPEFHEGVVEPPPSTTTDSSLARQVSE